MAGVIRRAGREGMLDRDPTGEIGDDLLSESDEFWLRSDPGNAVVSSYICIKL